VRVPWPESLVFMEAVRRLRSGRLRSVYAAFTVSSLETAVRSTSSVKNTEQDFKVCANESESALDCLEFEANDLSGRIAPIYPGLANRGGVCILFFKLVRIDQVPLVCKTLEIPVAYRERSRRIRLATGANSGMIDAVQLLKEGRCLLP
jgi:hypothetical protein